VYLLTNNFQFFLHKRDQVLPRKPQPVGIRQSSAVESETAKRCGAVLSSDWSRRVSTACLTALPDMGSSLDGLLWSRSALCHPRVLIRPDFDEYRVHIERDADRERVSPLRLHSSEARAARASLLVCAAKSSVSSWTVHLPFSPRIS
jgi:hypothetical protein